MVTNAVGDEPQASRPQVLGSISVRFSDTSFVTLFYVDSDGNQISRLIEENSKKPSPFYHEVIDDVENSEPIRRFHDATKPYGASTVLKLGDNFDGWCDLRIFFHNPPERPKILVLQGMNSTFLN